MVAVGIVVLEIVGVEILVVIVVVVVVVVMRDMVAVITVLVVQVKMVVLIVAVLVLFFSTSVDKNDGSVVIECGSCFGGGGGVNATSPTHCFVPPP